MQSPADINPLLQANLPHYLKEVLHQTPILIKNFIASLNINTPIKRLAPSNDRASLPINFIIRNYSSNYFQNIKSKRIIYLYAFHRMLTVLPANSR